MNAGLPCRLGTGGLAKACCLTGNRPVSKIDLNRILRESLPQWACAEFLFLEAEPWWAPSVQTVLARSVENERQPASGDAGLANGNATEYFCRSLSTTRSIHELVQSGPVQGLVLMVDQQMRDCLLLLGRFGRLGRPHPPTLVVIPDSAVPLMPLLLESGASAVMLKSKASDIRIADWCQRVAAAADHGR